LMTMMRWIWSVDKSLSVVMGELVMPLGLGSQWWNADSQCHSGMNYSKAKPGLCCQYPTPCPEIHFSRSRWEFRWCSSQVKANAR
jgi:hypothetical protein